VTPLFGLSPFALQLIDEVGEDAVAILRPTEAAVRPGADGVCVNCFGLVKVNDFGLALHVSGILGCADAIRSFCQKGTEW
jgi:hypothetical protein